MKVAHAWPPSNSRRLPLRNIVNGGYRSGGTYAPLVPPDISPNLMNALRLWLERPSQYRRGAAERGIAAVAAGAPHGARQGTPAVPLNF
jgi:hypothetical protein